MLFCNLPGKLPLSWASWKIDFLEIRHYCDKWVKLSSMSYLNANVRENVYSKFLLINVYYFVWRNIDSQLLIVFWFKPNILKLGTHSLQCA